MNVAICAKMAKSQKASMLFLPECFGFLGENSNQTFENAEDPVEVDTNKNSDSISKALIDSMRNDCEGVSPVVDADQRENTTVERIHLLDGLRTIAKETGLWISAGGMHELGAPPEEATSSDAGSSDGTTSPRIYNTHVVLDHQGEIQAVYRKMHLFDVSIPGKVELRESKTTAPGKDLVVCDSPLGKLGLSTCYDLRFPEQYIRLVQNGAMILLVPSAFTVPTGAAHWHTLLKARAIENQCYVLAAAQYGRHNDKRESFGHALAVDPWGKIRGDGGGYPLTDEEETSSKDSNKTGMMIQEPPSIITCEIDQGYVQSIRQRMPIDLHRSNALISL